MKIKTRKSETCCRRLGSSEHAYSFPDMDPNLSIILLGNSGAGKSASANTILGREAFVSKLSFKQVTKLITEETGEVFGIRIRVIDTPGILDGKDTEDEIKTCCQELLQSSRLNLFLVVVRIGRFTAEEQKAVEAAVRVLGPQGLKRSYLLFTGGDQLENKSLYEFIFEQDDGTLPDVVKKFAGAYHLFNNENKDQKQVRILLQKTGFLNTREQLPRPPAARLNTRRIVFLGLPGEGKSSSGNTILGSDQFKSGCNFNSVSTECVSASATVEGRQVKVVDTPGFTDAVLTPEQLYMEIMKTLILASPGPHAIVIVVRIGRVSEAHKKLFEILPILFGSDALKYAMVLFTGGDELQRGQSFDCMIQSNKYVSKLVSMCGGRYIVFNNTQRGNRQQVREFLNKIDEMVAASGEHCDSDMFRMAETFIREETNLSDSPTESKPKSKDCNLL